jgi:16S rRNA (adenine1518-N6/adenine1519-N6)-dimethyltransferase
MRTKKSLGQNFLKNKRILKKIADFAYIGKEDTVVEVGPGEGTLTELLLERAGQVIAVEKDEKLAKLLKDKFREQILDNRLQIINEDILNYELRIKNYALIGNIPYYITGALFKKFLENPPAGGQPKSITFVVQKEVAERIMGSHFAKASRDKQKESILSISIKAYGKPEYGGIIKAGSFSPKPKVDSAIIAIRNINKEKFKNIPEEKFFEILKKGFAHKRKLLIKNLAEVSKTVFELPRSQKTVFDTCEIPEKARAENLKVDNWICLAKNLL